MTATLPPWDGAGAPPDQPTDLVGQFAAGPAESGRPLAELLRNLRSSPTGLTTREAALRLRIYGSNVLTRKGAARWPRELLEQFTQPLALLLAVAAVLAWVGGTPALSVAVIAVIVLNAGFAFIQESQAERAVEALAAFLSATARVVRDGVRVDIASSDLVPGDVLVISEGDRIGADAHLIEGSLLLDLSAMTGESVPVTRTSEPGPVAASLLEASDLVFSGSTCLGGTATALVTRTAMHTELGRIASLSQRGKPERSPLETQVRRVTWIIAAVAVAVGAAFLPAGLAAGLGWSAAISFSIGLIVANVPEGLLPTITLALAAGVRDLARHGAVVKRLSAVETLGSVTVICTDKTGTLTENRMQVTRLWAGGHDCDATAPTDTRMELLVRTAAICTTADPPTPPQPYGAGDPTELALLRLATDLHWDLDPALRSSSRTVIYDFDPHTKRMTTINTLSKVTAVNTKGAVETVLPCCTTMLAVDGSAEQLDSQMTIQVQQTVDRYAQQGLRILAVARRTLGAGRPIPPSRETAEQGLTFLGLVGMADPPRASVADAVTQAHRAGVRVHVITGDYGPRRPRRWPGRSVSARRETTSSPPAG